MIEHDDGSATLPDPVNGDWYIHEVDDVWVADNPEQGRLRSSFNGDFPATFRTRDEALAALGAHE